MENKDKTKEQLIEELAEMKLSEEALRKSEAKFRSIFNHSVQFMGILDTNGILLEINQIALQIWGVKESDVINKPFWEAPWFSNPLELQTKVHKAIEDAAQGNFIHFEIKHIMSDGSYRYIDASLKPVNDADSKVVMLIAEGHDITECKKAETALKDSESKYRMLLNNIPQKIFYKDINSVYMLCNESYAKDLKIKTSVIIGKTDYDFYPKELAEKYITNDKEIMDSGKIAEIEEKYVADGKEMTVHTLKAPILDETGTTVGIFGIFWDITKRKKVEEELQKAHDELERHVRERTLELQEKNIALKVLLKQREEDKSDLEQNILSNVKSLIQPYISKLKRNNANSEDVSYLNIIESNLEDIISPFSQKLSSSYIRFSPKEIEIANLIKDGKKDKEIMEIMNIAFDTVKAHRKNIRKKLGIHGKGTNLRNKLLSI